MEITGHEFWGAALGRKRKNAKVHVRNKRQRLKCVALQNMICKTSPRLRNIVHTSN
jgi:hypothetical protein